MSNYLWTDGEWTLDKISNVNKALEEIATEKYGLDCYSNQIEVISSDLMLSAYSSNGLPVMYDHWSFGKSFEFNKEAYEKGHMGLAYEIVINSNPCIAYLMEENTMTMQALVIAHACYGHNSFFKNNYLFKQWTDASSIIDYLTYAKKYIKECEEKYGYDDVESILNICHSLSNIGIDKYKKPKILSFEQEKQRLIDRQKYIDANYSEIWETIPEYIDKHKAPLLEEDRPKYILPQENVLAFLEKHAPIKSWEREVIRITRKINQYFYPQIQTKVMNEGYATFWHYTLMHDLHERGYVTDGSMLEFYSAHSSVLYQPTWKDENYRGINPYTLGFNIFRDIRRICENPTKEDEQWFPDIAGQNWITTIDYAMRNFRDESFILQYLSPKVIRDLKLFSLSNNERNIETYIVNHIQDEQGYRDIREALSRSYNINIMFPDIQVIGVSSGTLELEYTAHDDVQLQANNREDVLEYIQYLWENPVYLFSRDTSNKFRLIEKVV